MVVQRTEYPIQIEEAGRISGVIYLWEIMSCETNMFVQFNTAYPTLGPQL